MEKVSPGYVVICYECVIQFLRQEVIGSGGQKSLTVQRPLSQREICVGSSLGRKKKKLEKREVGRKICKPVLVFHSYCSEELIEVLAPEFLNGMRGKIAVSSQKSPKHNIQTHCESQKKGLYLLWSQCDVLST